MTEQPKEQDHPFSESTSTSDVVLVVEDRQLHVNKGVLAVMYPVFDRMFFGDFKEKYSSEVPLPEKKYDDMLEFLFHIYPTTLKKRVITNETVEAVMMLADEYQVKSIFDECVTFLTKGYGMFKVTEMVHFLHLSEDKDRLLKVYNHFLDLVARNYSFRARKQKDEFDELSNDTRYMVLRKRVHLFETDSGFHNGTKPVFSFEQHPMI